MKIRPRVFHPIHWIVAASLGFGMVTEMIETTSQVMAEEAGTDSHQGLPDSPWQQGASFPVEQFTAYTSPFGYRQHPMGGHRFHYGLDLAAPLGSYVRNWWDGRVIRVASDNTCGTYVLVQSGDWTHVYCHLSGHIVVEK
ncbi:MAG TPA: M23 family metallopeptidase, partial [Leptolyngbyaceae cyanobacterium M65_K2018_010]|nr:M23 family metallopeptidase [Leptolyngbyaceae cyanobacterium M65_K2018_010]